MCKQRFLRYKLEKGSENEMTQLTHMNAQVGVERGATVERLATGLALVRLLLRVNDLMPAKGARLAESLSAHLKPADQTPFS